MQRLEVSGAVRLIYRSLGVKGLRQYDFLKPQELLVQTLGVTPQKTCVFTLCDT